MTVDHLSSTLSYNSSLDLRNSASPTIVIVGGPAGTGKTTVGQILTERLNSNPNNHTVFIEGDLLHPEQNIKKMASGIPLDDNDRWDWLKMVAQNSYEVCSKSGNMANFDEQRSPILCVASCSALKKVYRETIQDKVNELNSQSEIKTRLIFVFLHADQQVLINRTDARKNHFMASTMVTSQYSIMEVPEGSELVEFNGNALSVCTEGKTPEAITADVLETLNAILI